MSNKKKILIYKAEPICYGVLNHFADCMGEELTKLGEEIEYFDASESPLEQLVEKSHQDYKAVIGFQSYLFSIKFKDGRNLHDSFSAPCFNMILDHPIIMNNHMINAPDNMTILTHDRNYAKFIRTYYPWSKAVVIPPGGEILSGKGGISENVNNKCYDVSFVGSYRDWRIWQSQIAEIDQMYDGFGSGLLQWIKANPNETYEDAIRNYLKSINDSVDNPEDFRELVFQCKPTYLLAMDYYREIIIEKLLSSGIAIDVFGDSWKSSPLAQYRNLRIHPELNQEQTLEVYAKSKLTLNLMSWHKDGMTERIANAMLNKSVLISDNSTYLEENFRDGEELILFDLTEYTSLPGRIRDLLNHEDEIKAIAQKGYEAAVDNHTWQARAKALLYTIEHPEVTQ